MCSTNPKQRWREIQCSWTTVIRPTSFLTMHVWSQAIELNWTIITPGRLQQQPQFTKSSHLGKRRKNHKKESVCHICSSANFQSSILKVWRNTSSHQDLLWMNLSICNFINWSGKACDSMHSRGAHTVQMGGAHMYYRGAHLPRSGSYVLSRNISREEQGLETTM